MQASTSANPPSGFRGFLRTGLGRVVLILFAVGTVFATYAYVSVLLAIPLFLIVGLGLPIYLGIKRPRFLALVGLVVLLAVAPLATVVFSQIVLIPPTAASSSSQAPDGSGGAVLQHASVDPYTGTSSTNFTWNVTIYPQYLVGELNGTNWSHDSVELFVSTCPGATDKNSSYCQSGYELIVQNYTFTTPPSPGTVVTFHNVVGSSGIWTWTMDLAVQNKSNASDYRHIYLAGDPTYNAIEGPVIGGFATVYGLLIGEIYFVELIYLGIPFFFILLLYAWFKGRERRRKEFARRLAGGIPPTSGASTSPQLPSGEAGSAPPGGTETGAGSAGGSNELACRSCGAVVYASETRCWKCGAGLGAGPGAQPLPGGPTPPPASGT